MTGRRGFSNLVAVTPRKRQARIRRITKTIREDKNFPLLREARSLSQAAE